MDQMKMNETADTVLCQCAQYTDYISLLTLQHF